MPNQGKSHIFAKTSIMLYRKFAKNIEDFLHSEPEKIMLVNGARQIGKSFIIRYVGTRLFPNFVEINLREDKEGPQLFANVRTTTDLYIQLGIIAGDKLGRFEDTLVFLDEIQEYPQLLTMLKFLRQDKRYRFIASGSLLGVALHDTGSVPIGSIQIEQMYPLDFEEFLFARGFGTESIESLRNKCLSREALDENTHGYMIKLFREYLVTGGLPEAVDCFLSEFNVVKLRRIQRDIHNLYKIDCSKYDREKKLSIRKVYDIIPSLMENRKKRLIVKDIEGKRGKQFSDYDQEFEYLINAGVALEVRAISNPTFPISESETKSLLKLYLNDVGILSYLLYNTNINAILNNETSVNLGNVYETAVAQELHAHGFKLRYYDNKQKGEVDFLVDDYDSLSVLPIEVKSGKDYKVHSALDAFLNTPDYGIKRAVVLSNERKVYEENGIIYMPIYYISFFLNNAV